MNSQLSDFNAKSFSDDLTETSRGFWSSHKHDTLISYPSSHHGLLIDSQVESFWYQHRLRCIRTQLRKINAEFLVDIGGSIGSMARSMSSIVPTILMEPQLDGVNHAYQSGVVPVVHANLLDINVKSDCLPAVSLLDVLEHIEDDRAFLEIIFRALKPGGHILITVPAHQKLWSDFDVKVGHYRRYKLNQLISILKTVGFEIEFSTYLFSLLYMPLLLRRKFLRRKNENFVADHFSVTGLIGKIAMLVLLPEWLLFRTMTRIPFGTSCMCLARKPLT